MNPWPSPILLATLVLLAGVGPLAAASEEEDVALAKKGLAAKTGAAADEIEVESAKAVEWHDRSLGCPKKGMTYSPVIVPGHLVQLRVAGRSYRVHVGDGRAVVCGPAHKQNKPVAPERSAPALALIYEARRDLARRLELDERSIRVLSVAPTSWPDTSLGCPQDGEEYAQVETPGYVIELAAEDRTFLYHSDLERVVTCPKPEEEAEDAAEKDCD